LVRGPTPTKQITAVATPATSLLSAKKVDVTISDKKKKDKKSKKDKKKKRKSAGDSSSDADTSDTDNKSNAKKNGNSNNGGGGDGNDEKSKQSNEGFGSFLGMGHTKDQVRNKVQELFSAAIGDVPASCLVPPPAPPTSGTSYL
jgi:hypothetical protein